jgi:putative salt-induced outer membrane protein YdiY
MAAQIVFFVRPFLNLMRKSIVILFVAAGVLTAFPLDVCAQANVITVTNVVTVTVTNFVTVTNILAKTDTGTTTADVAAAGQAVPPTKYPWESSVGTGLTLTRGNSDTLLITASIQTHKKTPDDEISLGADGAYGENNSVANVNNAHGFSQYNHLFSDRFFGYLRADALHDGIADLQYRITVGPGAGYYFLKETNTSLAGEIGPSFVNQRLGDVDDDYAILRVAERLEHKFDNYGARVWQNVEVMPEVDKFKNCVVNAEIGIESSITKQASLKTCLQDTFANEPAAGREKNDIKLVSGISYKF